MASYLVPLFSHGFFIISQTCQEEFLWASSVREVFEIMAASEGLANLSRGRRGDILKQDGSVGTPQSWHEYKVVLLCKYFSHTYAYPTHSLSEP